MVCIQPTAAHRLAHLRSGGQLYLAVLGDTYLGLVRVEIILCEYRYKAKQRFLMQVAKGKVVAIDYTLRTNGVVRYVAPKNKPLKYIHGAGSIIPGLEKALEGKTAGDQVSVTVPPEEGYGQRDDSLQQKVEAEVFRGVEALEAGMQFQAQSEDKKRLETVTIVEVDEEEQTVTLDTNHPLAGQTLEFNVTVNEVRDATEEESAQGYVTPPPKPRGERYHPPEPHTHHEHDHSHEHSHSHEHGHEH